VKKDGITDLPTCKDYDLKLRFYGYLLGVLSRMGVELYRVTVEFAGKDLAFLVPTLYAERALYNLEHVLCDYYQVPGVVPRPGNRVLDVGGFLGFYTVASAALVDPGGVVYSVEPVEKIFSLLYENIRLNRLSHVYAYPIAVCPESGFKKLYVGDYPAVSSLLREHVEHYASVESVIEVKCIKMSNLLGYIGVLDVLKLDIEGLEVDVLKEALGELRRTRAIVVEVHTNVVDSGEVVRLLNEAGFNKTVVYVPADAPNQVIAYATR